MDTRWTKSGQLLDGSGEVHRSFKNSAAVARVGVGRGGWHVRNSILVATSQWKLGKNGYLAGCGRLQSREGVVENWPWRVGVRGGIWVGSIEYWDYYNYQVTCR